VDGRWIEEDVLGDRRRDVGESVRCEISLLSNPFGFSTCWLLGVLLVRRYWFFDVAGPFGVLVVNLPSNWNLGLC
jgi:hypothetical protein